MNESYQLLSALNGVAVKCIFCFVWERRQLTITELEPRVGHDKNTVRKAMRQLALYGLAAEVISSQETWCLTDKGYQLPLPMDALPSGEVRISPSPTTTTTVLTSFSPLQVNQVVEVSTRGGEILTTTPLTREEEDALSALHKVGIMGKKAMELCRLEWITPEYVAGMHARWQSEGRTSRETGLLIKYMSDGDPAPAICEECGGVGGHHADCQSFGDLIVLARLVAIGDVKSVKRPSPALIQAMMK